MELSDLLLSYNQIKVPTRVIEDIKFPSLEYPEINNPVIIELLKEQKKEQKKPVTYYTSTIKAPGMTPTIKGSLEFERAYDEVEKTNPDAKKYRAFLTKMALKESGFNKSILNQAGAPAYGYFLFMEDGKKYHNISTYAGTDINTFRNNPKLQIEAAIKLAKSFEKGFSKEDKKLAEEQGFTTFGLLGGAWLGGVGGVRKYLKGQGNPSDRHWSKSGKGTDIATRIREFNFRKGGVIRKYLNAGTILADNTRVTRPIIQEKVPRTYRSSQALFVQDNRSNWEHEQASKQANDAYELYIEDKRTEEGLNNLNGFLTFTDYATLGLGAGSLITKGLKLAGKKAVKKKLNDLLQNIKIGDLISNLRKDIPSENLQLPDYAVPNSQQDALLLHESRLNSGGFDNIPGIVGGKSKFRTDNNLEWNYKSTSPLYNIYYYDKNSKEYADRLINDFLLASNRSLSKEDLNTVVNLAKDREALGALGTGNIYIGRNGVLKLSKEFSKHSNNINRLISHEVDHAIHIPAEPPTGFNVQYLKRMIPSLPDYMVGKNGTELAARGAQIKNYFGLTSPNLEITEDMLKYAAKHYVDDTGIDNNMITFFNSIVDWKEAAKWLSKYSTIISVPTVINDK